MDNGTVTFGTVLYSFLRPLNSPPPRDESALSRDQLISPAPPPPNASGEINTRLTFWYRGVSFYGASTPSPPPRDDSVVCLKGSNTPLSPIHALHFGLVNWIMTALPHRANSVVKQSQTDSLLPAQVFALSVAKIRYLKQKAETQLADINPAFSPP